ncbi:MAG TPA: hypothetical protein PKG93_04650 [Bacilli bacterium]|nr:hypothetical protein [Bacilli bacterium]
MIPEIGDKFIINWKEMIKKCPGIKMCYFPDLEFTIDRFTQSGIIIFKTSEKIDGKTNKKCKCSLCSNDNDKCIGIDDNDKCIGIDNITLTRKKLSIDRNRKLNELGI